MVSKNLFLNILAIYSSILISDSLKKATNKNINNTGIAKIIQAAVDHDLDPALNTANASQTQTAVNKS